MSDTIRKFAVKSVKFYSTVLATENSYATHYRRKRGFIEAFEYLGEFEKIFENVGDIDLGIC
jgi:hypothetical protein